jgi:hypothetical protein
MPGKQPDYTGWAEKGCCYYCLCLRGAEIGSVRNVDCFESLRLTLLCLLLPIKGIFHHIIIIFRRLGVAIFLNWKIVRRRGREGSGGGERRGQRGRTGGGGVKWRVGERRSRKKGKGTGGGREKGREGNEGKKGRKNSLGRETAPSNSKSWLRPWNCVSSCLTNHDRLLCSRVSSSDVFQLIGRSKNLGLGLQLVGNDKEAWRHFATTRS